MRRAERQASFSRCTVFVGQMIRCAVSALQTYVYLPLLKDLDEAVEEFREFNRYVESSGGEVDETFDGDFRKRIIDAADANTRTNEKRTEILRLARLWLFAVPWLTALAGIPYVVDQVLRK